MSLGPTVSTIKWQKNTNKNKDDDSEYLDLMKDWFIDLYDSSYYPKSGNNDNGTSSLLNHFERSSNSNVSLSGICDYSYVPDAPKFRYITCEYCGTKSNVSVCYTSCEYCGAPYGFIDSLINTCYAAPRHVALHDDEYLIISKEIINNIFDCIPYFNRRTDELHSAIKYLTRESTIKIVELLRGFIKPDMVSNKK